MESIIAYRFRIPKATVEQLDDETFFTLAALAVNIREMETEVVRDGILKALEMIKFE